MESYSMAKDRELEATIVRWKSGIELSLYQKMKRFKYLIFKVELVSTQGKNHEKQGVGEGGG